jgi:hypothetical protein
MARSLEVALHQRQLKDSRPIECSGAKDGRKHAEQKNGLTFILDFVPHD